MRKEIDRRDVGKRDELETGCRPERVTGRQQMLDRHNDAGSLR